MRNTLTLLTVLFAFGIASAADPLTPYTGPTVRGVDTSTLTGKVMTGYQG